MERWSHGCWRGVVVVVFSGLVGASEVSVADNATDLEALKRTVNRQESLIQQLTEKIAQMEARLGGSASSKPISSTRVNVAADELAALPPEMVQSAKPPPITWGGYLDVGYVEPAGSGTVSTGALQVNSRGDNLSTLGLDGDSSLLVNELNLDLVAHPAPQVDVVTNLAFLPRKLSITTTGGSAFTDAFEVNLAYLAYEPFPKEAGPLIDNLFGDLKLSLGKFDSTIGLEYRYNKAPDRVNISRSMMSIYWTGYPVGLKARGKLFQEALGRFRNSVLTYNLSLTNAEPWMSTVFGADGDRAQNQRLTIGGRLSYGLDLFKGAFFETGVSLANGSRFNQGDNTASANSIDLDGRVEWGPLTVRAEYDYSDLNRSLASGATATASTFSHIYIESFYEIPRPRWLPRAIPLVSLTPYYRYDTRDLNSTTAAGLATTLVEANRHTFALRYILNPGRILKAEYQLNGEAEGASVNDNVFLASFLQQF